MKTQMVNIWVISISLRNKEILVTEPDLEKTVIVKIVRRFENFTLDVTSKLILFRSFLLMNSLVRS